VVSVVFNLVSGHRIVALNVVWEMSLLWFRVFSIVGRYTYLNRKEKVERAKLQAFKAWARVRGQITVLKTVVVPRE
jgi:hypothetical protein